MQWGGASEHAFLPTDNVEVVFSFPFFFCVCLLAPSCNNRQTRCSSSKGRGVGSKESQEHQLLLIDPRNLGTQSQNTYARTGVSYHTGIHTTVHHPAVLSLLLLPPLPCSTRMVLRASDCYIQHLANKLVQQNFGQFLSCRSRFNPTPKP